MNIDDSIVRSYLHGKDVYQEHWLFYQISDDHEYTFSKPSSDLKELVEETLNKTLHKLNNFQPFNEHLFTTLFPKWKELIKDVNIILSVGSPAPYDAMVREHEGKEYMIFDLVRFLEYQKDGEDILSLIRQMITHEITHVCVHHDYPIISSPYKEALRYITFDEGFAHLLAYKENLETYNFQPIINEHYLNARNTLTAALLETDVQKQKGYLETSNCGSYWDKFAAISGKLYLASNINQLKDIYKSGPTELLNKIIND